MYLCFGFKILCWAQNTMAVAWSAPGCCTLWRGGSTSTGRTSGGWALRGPAGRHDVPLRRVMKAFLACGMPTLALVELLHFAGIIAPDAASERNGSYRLMFGYGHPNTFGGVMFGLLLAWVLLRRTRLTWPELAGDRRGRVPDGRPQVPVRGALHVFARFAAGTGKAAHPQGLHRAADRWQRSARPRCRCWPRSVIFYRCLS